MKVGYENVTIHQSSFIRTLSLSKGTYYKNIILNIITMDMWLLANKLCYNRL